MFPDYTCLVWNLYPSFGKNRTRFYFFLNKLYLYTKNKTLLHRSSHWKRIMVLICSFRSRHKVVAASTLGKNFTRKEEINSWRDAKRDINMEISKYLTKFDGQSKLLIRSLVCRPFDAHKALTVFQRQQRANPGLSLLNLLKILCREEVTSPQTKSQPLTM